MYREVLSSHPGTPYPLTARTLPSIYNNHATTAQHLDSPPQPFLLNASLRRHEPFEGTGKHERSKHKSKA